METTPPPPTPEDPGGRRAAVRSPRPPAGFTLVEIIVVLVLMGLAVGLVAPALVPPESPASGLDRLTRTARRAAVTRAQTLRLEVDPDGTWRLLPATASGSGPLAEGALDAAFERAVAFAFSPLGSCTELQRAGGRQPHAGLWTPVGGPRSRVADPLSCRLSET